MLHRRLIQMPSYPNAKEIERKEKTLYNTTTSSQIPLE